MTGKFRFFSFGQALFVCRIAYRGNKLKNFSRIAKGLLNMLLRPDSPATLIIGVTYKCNFTCHYCSSGAYPAAGPLLDAAEINDAIDQAAALGISRVNFFGGEPLLREDITELVRHADSRGMLAFMDTNGELLDQASLIRLREAGITAVSVNVQTKDSCGADDALNEPAIFLKMEKISGDCAAAGVPFMFSLYVDNRVLAGGLLEKIIRRSRERGACGVRLLLPIDCGRLEGRAPEISAQDLKRVHALIDNRFVCCETVLYSAAGGVKLCEARSKKTIYLSPYGDVQFCSAVPFSFGSIRKEKLGEIIRGMHSHELFLRAPADNCAMNDAGFKAAMRDPARTAKQAGGGRPS